MARQFKLESFEADNENEIASIDYKEVLTMVCRNPSDPKAGMDYEEMGRRLNILEKLRAKEKEDIILLENDEHSLLLSHCKKWRWVTANEAVTTMIESIENAEKIDINEAKKDKKTGKD